MQQLHWIVPQCLDCSSCRGARTCCLIARSRCSAVRAAASSASVVPRGLEAGGVRPPGLLPAALAADCGLLPGLMPEPGRGTRAKGSCVCLGPAPNSAPRFANSSCSRSFSWPRADEGTYQLMRSRCRRRLADGGRPGGHMESTSRGSCRGQQVLQNTRV